MSDDQRAVVIGSGPSGATAALTLLEQGIPVTMLESGVTPLGGMLVRAFGRNLFRKWPLNSNKYGYTASGDPDSLWHNALAPGGLSNYWTGAVPRFAPEDFYEGERLHARYRWPIGYADLAPYYARMERLLGVVGERRAVPQVPAPEVLAEECSLPAAWGAIARSAEQSGQGLIRTPIADGDRWLLRPSGAAFNSFERIVRRLSRFPQFELRLGAHATRLSLDPVRTRVTGVEYVDRIGGAPHWLAASAVVVAAGPLASPKLLLQSTSHDFPEGLGNSHGVLGRFLHDHPMDWCVLSVDTPLPRLDTPLHLSRAPYADSAPLLGASLSISALSKWDRLLSAAGATTSSFGLVTFGTMVPTSSNYVRLHPDQKDEFGLPLLDIHVQFAAETRATIATAHERMRAIFERAGYRVRLECPVDRLTPGASAHYGGAARMHSSPEYGVLDGWSRLHDVDNVVVADASAFTTGVEKNPTLTAMALSARAADELAQDLKNDNIGARRQATHALSAPR